MKMSKKVVNWLQNLLLVLLTLSAVTLLTRIPMFSEGWDDRVQALFSVSPTESVSTETEDLASIIPSVHLVSTDDSEYGRYSQLYVDANSPDLAGILPLFQEALGSAAGMTPANHHELQSALDSPSLFLALTSELPLDIVAAWLGGETSLNQTIRAMALTTDGSDSATLYLCISDGSVFRYTTALTASAIYAPVHTFSPNGGSFAFESSYSTLQPYTVLVSQTTQYLDVYSGIPDGYSAYNLLTALDFNAHTNSRYFETSGSEVVEVVVESPRTLRIGPNGTVVYNGDRYVASPLYQTTSAGETPTAMDALQAAIRLASVLTHGTDASPLYLQQISSTDTGWRIDFNYQSQGLPVVLANGEQALSVSINGGVITSFTYCCRSFTPTETLSTLLPPSIAVAIAAQYPQSDLTICYTDSSEELLSAQWLAG